MTGFSAKKVAVIGGGPAGLMAAEALCGAGHNVTAYEAMPSFGRKLLFAGKSGLNITHAEDYAQFATRFSAASARLRPALDGFRPNDLIAWAGALGTETFTGSSGRVFPKAMKASPLLRAWLRRLADSGVTLLPRHRWTGVEANALHFETPDGALTVAFDAVVLALGGASWPKLGATGDWVPLLRRHDVPVADLRPANCGFDVDWSAVFAARFAGQPVKSVTATSDAGTLSGEFVVSGAGVEGSLIYAHAAALRDRIAADGEARLTLDLASGRSFEKLVAGLARQKPKESFTSRLRKGAGLEGIKGALVRECAPDANTLAPDALARLIKALPLTLVRPRPLAEAISSAGGIGWDGVDDNYMLTALPGVFAAGEMLDWEAPTGGYLLTGCMATGLAAGQGAARWLANS